MVALPFTARPTAQPIDSFLASMGATLVDNGYSIIPIKPGDKAPGAYSNGQWHNLKGWQQFCERQPTEDEIAAWSKWPAAGIGFPCGNIVGIDIDVEDAATSQKVAELARMRLGDTPALRIGKHPKQMLVYRAKEPFQSFDAKPLQVLAKGRQFVGYGIHPSTGVPYSWPESSLNEVDLASLPVITQDQARAFISEAIKLIPAEMRPAALNEFAVEGAVAAHEATTYEAVEEALNFVVSDMHTPRDEWIKIGMAIKAGLGETGRDLWHKWSAMDAARYTAKECDTQWKSFKPDRDGRSIGIGTLFDKARLSGWTPSEGVYLYAYDKEVAENGPTVDIDAFIENMKQKAADKEKQSAAPIVVDPVRFVVPQGEPGWLRDLGDNAMGDFVRYICEMGFYPQPEMALAAALAAFGTAGGRRYRTQQNSYSNIYTIGLLDSGAGKDAPLQAAKQLLYQAGLHKHLGGSAVASGAAIVTALTHNPTTLFVLDEIGFLFEAAKSGKQQAGHMLDLTSKITEFYHQPGLWAGKAHADTKEKPTTAIYAPCLSILGMSTPVRFWGAFNSMNAGDGSLARFVVFESKNQFPMPQLPEARDVPDHIVDVAKRMADMQPQEQAQRSGNLDTMPYPKIVPFEGKAGDFVMDLMMRERELKIGDENTGLNAINSRITQNATKVAIIRAACENPESPVISRDCIEWGWQLAQNSANTIKARIGDSISDNDYEAHSKLVERVIREAGPEGITTTDMYEPITRKMGVPRREEILKALEQAGRIKSFPLKTPGRPGHLYIFVA